MSARDELEAKGCTGKVRRTADNARASAAHMRVRDGDRRVSAYRCPWCGSWHVGHQPDMRTVERMARVIRGFE